MEAGEASTRFDTACLTQPVLSYIPCPARPQSTRTDNPFHRWDTPAHQLWLAFYRSGDNRYLLRFDEYADFLIDFVQGKIEAYPTPQITSATLEHLYLNQILPLVQSHQGQLVLHGSAVVIEGAAVAFLGQSGAGKSTLATSFALAGFPFLTDDGLILTGGAEGLHVMPSHPTVRLWEDSRLSLLGDGATTVMPVQYNSKARIVSSSSMPYCDQPQALRAIYILGLEESAEGLAQEAGQAKDDPIHICRLSPANAVIALINHSFVLDIEAREVIARHFDQLTNVASHVPCYSLHYPQRYEVLNRVQQALKRHCTELEERKP